MTQFFRPSVRTYVGNNASTSKTITLILCILYLGISGFGVFGVLGFWVFRYLGFWVYRYLGFWCFRVLGFWGIEVVYCILYTVYCILYIVLCTFWSSFS